MSLITDIAQYLETNALGTVGTNIFCSYLPADTTNSMAIYNTGGVEPDKYLPTKNPTFQVYITASSYATGEAKLNSVRSLLHQIKNTTIGSTYFYFILAIAEGGHLGVDEAGSDLFSINFRCRTR